MHARRVILTLAFLLVATCGLAPTSPLSAQQERIVEAGGEGRRVGVGFSPGENVVLLVAPGSLAEQAGLRVDDVVVSLNGRTMAEHGDGLVELMRSSEPLVFIVQRGDERLTLTIGDGAGGFPPSM